MWFEEEGESVGRGLCMVDLRLNADNGKYSHITSRIGWFVTISHPRLVVIPRLLFQVANKAHAQDQRRQTGGTTSEIVVGCLSGDRQILETCSLTPMTLARPGITTSTGYL